MTARRVLLAGLARDADVFELVSELAPLHPRDNTFPGEVFLRLAADALDWCGASRADPLPLEGLRERFLPECTFRGRQNTKLQYAVLAAAALHGGTEPDLLDEVAWWQADDFWQYALFAAVACIRAAPAGRASRCARRARTWPSALATRRHDAHFGTQPKRSSDGGWPIITAGRGPWAALSRASPAGLAREEAGDEGRLKLICRRAGAAGSMGSWRSDSMSAGMASPWRGNGARVAARRCCCCMRASRTGGDGRR